MLCNVSKLLENFATGHLEELIEKSGIENHFEVVLKMACFEPDVVHMVSISYLEFVLGTRSLDRPDDCSGCAGYTVGQRADLIKGDMYYLWI